MRGGVKGHRGLREEGERSAGEGGRNRDTGRPLGEAETGGRTTTTRRRTTAETGRRRQGHDQVSSDGGGGEPRERWESQEEIDNASKGGAARA